MKYMKWYKKPKDVLGPNKTSNLDPNMISWKEDTWKEDTWKEDTWKEDTWKEDTWKEDTWKEDTNVFIPNTKTNIWYETQERTPVAHENYFNIEDTQIDENYFNIEDTQIDDFEMIDYKETIKISESYYLQTFYLFYICTVINKISYGYRNFMGNEESTIEMFNNDEYIMNQLNVKILNITFFSESDLDTSFVLCLLEDSKGYTFNVLCCRGTKTIEDYKLDAKVFFNLSINNSLKFIKLRELIENLCNNRKNPPLILTGHSLGGKMCLSINKKKEYRNCITKCVVFNPAINLLNFKFKFYENQLIVKHVLDRISPRVYMRETTQTRLTNVIVIGKTSDADSILNLKFKGHSLIYITNALKDIFHGIPFSDFIFEVIQPAIPLQI